MFVVEQDFEVPVVPGHRELLSHLAEATRAKLSPGMVPLRFVVSETTPTHYRCEVACLSGAKDAGRAAPAPIFQFKRRAVVNNDKFTVMHIVPTGIGAEIGGHVGDAAPAARMLAETCDTLLTHPNVVNAADINEMPHNSLYVEGSVLSRLLMGTVGLQRTRSNRTLVVMEENRERKITYYSINAVNAAVASGGFNCYQIVRLAPPFKMTAVLTESGRAAGRIESLEGLLAALDQHRHEFDAVALTSVIDYPKDETIAYYKGASDTVNPWGGVEAMLTHAISSLYNVPSAHSPQLSTTESYNIGLGHPTMAAELISSAYLHCILKGLQQSPAIVTSPEAMNHPSVITASDISCLVMPDRCLGLPTLAALEQRIPVIAVRDRSNQLRNDLSALPWAPGQLHFAENYFEAAGMISAMRSGIAMNSLRRPLPRLPEEQRGQRE
jgi:hypothetical protein